MNGWGTEFFVSTDLGDWGKQFGEVITGFRLGLSGACGYFDLSNSSKDYILALGQGRHGSTALLCDDQARWSPPVITRFAKSFPIFLRYFLLSSFVLLIFLWCMQNKYRDSQEGSKATELVETPVPF
jgi:hypothetical protein